MHCMIPSQLLHAPLHMGGPGDGASHVAHPHVDVGIGLAFFGSTLGMVGTNSGGLGQHDTNNRARLGLLSRHDG